MLILRDISIIMRHMRTYAERALAESGIGFPEQLVIMCLQNHGSASQDDIARYLEIDKGAVARTVAKLEAKGLVTREVSLGDRRRYVVCLTAKANPVVAQMAQGFTQWFQDIFAGIDADEAQAVTRTLATMAVNAAAMNEKGETR